MAKNKQGARLPGYFYTKLLTPILYVLQFVDRLVAVLYMAEHRILTSGGWPIEAVHSRFASNTTRNLDALLRLFTIYLLRVQPDKGREWRENTCRER